MTDIVKYIIARWAYSVGQPIMSERRIYNSGQIYEGALPEESLLPAFVVQ